MDISPRLSAILDRALEYRITEIVAPVGFGKSTLLNDLAGRGFLLAPIRPDVDPALALMRALCEAVSLPLPDLLRALPTAFENASLSSKLELGSWFARSLRGSTYKIAVDDLHYLADDETAWNLLVDAIEATRNDGTQWVLSSRIWPKLPTTSWIADGEEGAPITESQLAISGNDLEYICSSFGATLEPKEAVQIISMTKGWPLLCAYAARLLAQGVRSESLFEAISGRGVAAIADRLLAGVNDADLRLLLTVTVHDGALPEDLNASNPQGAQNVYALARAGLPLTQGNDRRWRLHEVLREHILIRLPAQCREEADRIALELESRRELDEALEICLAAGSQATLLCLLERNSRHFTDAGSPTLLRRALSKFTRNVVETNPVLALLRGIEEMVRGESAVAIGFLRRAVDLSDGNSKTYAKSRLLQGLINSEGRLDAAATVVDELRLEQLPEAPVEACEVLGQLAQAFALFGDASAAEDSARAVIELLPAASDPVVESRTYLRIGRVALSLSNLSDAETFADRAIDLGEQHRLFDSLFWAYHLRLLIAAVNNESRAIACAQKMLANASQILNKRAVYAAESSLFGYACRAAKLDEARALRKRLFPIPTDRRTRFGSTVLIISAQLAMLEANYWEAARLLAEIRDFGEREIDGTLVTVREIVFRAETAMLNQLTGACTAAVRETGKVLELCSVLNLQGAAIAATPDLEIAQIMSAAIFSANGMLVQAETILDDLAKNAHEQYRRDLAAWVSAALSDRNAEPSDAAIEHAKGIVELIRRAIAPVEQASLTRTERRVLESLALGRSSKEMAAFAGKSVKTIDNHVAAILRKLQAHSRGEAVARARRTGLLTDQQEETVKA